MARYDDRRDNAFLMLWTLAVIATTASFLFYLAVRVRSVELGYDLGDAHARLARMRELERVLELERSAHETPERVDLVARSLLSMDEPDAARMLKAGKDPEVGSDAEEDALAQRGAQ